MNPDVERSIAEAEALRGPMLRKMLYAVLWTKVGDVSREALAPLLPDHLRFMLDLERRGVLFASGPLFEPDGTPSLHGLTVLRAPSVGGAAEIAAEEPYVLRGMRTFRVWGWELNEGRLHLDVQLGTGKVDVV